MTDCAYLLTVEIGLVLPGALLNLVLQGLNLSVRFFNVLRDLLKDLLLVGSFALSY